MEDRAGRIPEAITTQVWKTAHPPDHEENFMSALQQAIEYWSEDMPIPLDLAMELASEGYDVEALEDFYRQ